ncbi:putative COP9 signalosome complex subunit 5A [Cutaneotrichosporon oleaginosum]|uniref:COP9 signalosome complex subunit 5 n=1 Tax=Cutaneotrichosporon oleaginosum TaxID=879819 RepID=A0A0J0XP02_9TREE|nr:putative COP9 signalosome complex subunit 5A [Cutaneotrichosporon oleaginosum]KLT42838.1 putative COP9 signalosome complex subunit 5A [Cutaneotrichosporon oleaginosum]TXT08196.1 hypothetical protein COLE_05120 [Cutaneotrichosporon oleaginosum]
MEQAARTTFEINNSIATVDPAELVFLYSAEEERQLEDQAPWATDPHYFQTVKISAVALIKMAIHARSGGQYEIMGVMYGRVRDRAFWITDAVALPVQGTETRVNAGNEAMEYMVEFHSARNAAGQTENQRGWYHSHPGYGCWLSGIDVDTQMTNQTHQDPYLAVVVRSVRGMTNTLIDPNRTVSAGKVEIGAFRTYPLGYTPPSGGSSEYQSIPLDKIEDFGAHANAYYPLKVEIYKSKTDEKLLDLLWNKYWVETLSQNRILSNRAYTTSQVKDLNAKLRAAEAKVGESTAELRLKASPPGAEEGGKEDFHGLEIKPSVLGDPVKDSHRIANEAKNAMTANVIKAKLFNEGVDKALSPAEARDAARGLRSDA